MDGSHLADYLIEKGGNEIHGLVRRNSTGNLDRISNITDCIAIHVGDILDVAGLTALFKQVKPWHIYNFAAQSFVKASFDNPLYTANATGIGALNVFEAARQVCPEAKIYQASSSEMFGNDGVSPVSPYGAAKLFAHNMAGIYRTAYDMFICRATNFNHESERRGLEFVTRKITSSIARIKAGLQDTLFLGDTSSVRDWSYAPDVVEAAYYMMNSVSPGDYTVCSGESHSVEEFLQEAFRVADLSLEGHVVRNDKTCIRPYELKTLYGNNEKIRNELGWYPKVGFKEIVKRMVENDLALVGYRSVQV